jgi:hypothetical protein
MTAVAHQLVRAPVFSATIHEPLEVAVARRAAELDASYGVLFCIARSLGVGRSLDYDPSTHEFVLSSHDRETRHPAGRFEGWSP